tara:strand:- start:67 stop:219 length:153 start_codon:yes stop_codon:yes gene_type:complete
VLRKLGLPTIEIALTVPIRPTQEFLPIAMVSVFYFFDLAVAKIGAPQQEV